MPETKFTATEVAQALVDNGIGDVDVESVLNDLGADLPDREVSFTVELTLTVRGALERDDVRAELEAAVSALDTALVDDWSVSKA